MNANELLLQKIIADPSLLKMIEKMAKAAPAERKQIKLKQAGYPTYVNKVTQVCKLCKTETIIYLRMDWDKESKLYRSGCHHLDNIWPDLPEHSLRQSRQTCKTCPETLGNLDKESLISKLIILSEKI